MDKVKVKSLKFRGFKRVDIVAMELNEDGMFVIGGRNGQGKTTILDGSKWLLGGDKFKPSCPQNTNSDEPLHMEAQLSNGLMVYRTGKNSTLKVVDPEGNKYKQSRLNGFIDTFALDAHKFLDASDKVKAEKLLEIIGKADEIAAIEQKEKAAEEKRRDIGRDLKLQKGNAESYVIIPNVPEEVVSIAELSKKFQEAEQINKENKKFRDAFIARQDRIFEIQAEITALQNELNMKASAHNSELDQYKTLQDVDMSEITRAIESIEEINNQVRNNIAAKSAMRQVEELTAKHNSAEEEVKAARQEKTDLLNNANLPLPGLSIDNGELTFNGQRWDCMSSAEQIMVAISIIQVLNPKCGFLLVDKLEQIDSESLKAFKAWLKGTGLQVIGTRVSTNPEECDIIIEDGKIAI